jgi:hypothetical protein
MASKAGDIFINIAAEFARFRTDIVKLGGDIASFAKDSASHLGALTTSMEAAEEGVHALGLAVGIGAFVEFGKQVLEMASSIKTMATQTGLGTQELQVWQATARATSVDVDSVRGGLEAFNRAVGSVADGNKQAVETFNQLGIGVLASNNQLRTISDLSREAASKIAAMKDPVDQARAAHELFGKSGQQLLPVLKEIGTAYDEAAQHAADAGQLVSDAAINTADVVENKFGEMVQAIKVLVANFIADSEPMITQLGKIGDQVAGILNKITAWEAEQAKHPLLNLFGEGGFISGMFGSGPSTAQMRGVPEFPGGAPLGSEDFLSSLGGSFGLGGGPGGPGHNPIPTSDIAAASKEAEKQAAAIAKVIEGLKFETEQLGLNKEQQRLNNELRKAGVDLMSPEGQEINRLVTLNSQLAAGQKTQADLEAEAVKVREDAMTSLEKYNRDVDELIKLYRVGLITEKQFTAEQANLKKALDDADPAVQQAKKDADEWKQATDDLVTSLGRDLVRAFTDSGSAADRWRNLAVHALEDVLDAMDGLLKKALGSVVSGTLGSLFGDIAGGIFGSGGVSISADAAAGLSPSFAHLAGGGPMDAGEWAVVGENGPELFRASGPGDVWSNRDLMSLSGGAPSAYYNIDARGADSAAIARLERTLRELHKSIEPRAVAAVSSERKRGGAFAAAFAR